MLDDCLREENHIRQEYDLIYIMMGSNNIRHNKDRTSAVKKLIRIAKGIREQKPQTNIMILEIPTFLNHHHQKETNSTW